MLKGVVRLYERFSLSIPLLMNRTVKVALAVAVPRLWDSPQTSNWSHFHFVLSCCGQPFLLEMVNLTGKVPCRLTAFSKFITASQKVRYVNTAFSVSVRLPPRLTLGNILLQKWSHSWTCHQVGSESRREKLLCPSRRKEWFKSV